MDKEVYMVKMTKSQLRLMIAAVEDWTRFVSGQCEMNNATALVNTTWEEKDNLNKIGHQIMTPELPLNASYGWNGGNCQNLHQRKAIAMGYLLYREPLHFLTVNSDKKQDWNVYNGDTLTCPEQGPMITIEKVIMIDKKQQKENSV